LTDFAEAFMS
jgi:putative ABC transport system substrate-binding protein